MEGLWINFPLIELTVFSFPFLKVKIILHDAQIKCFFQVLNNIWGSIHLDFHYGLCSLLHYRKYWLLKFYYFNQFLNIFVQLSSKNKYPKNEVQNLKVRAEKSRENFNFSLSHFSIERYGFQVLVPIGLRAKKKFPPSPLIGGPVFRGFTFEGLSVFCNLSTFPPSTTALPWTL